MWITHVTTDHTRLYAVNNYVDRLLTTQPLLWITLHLPTPAHHRP